MLLLCHAHTLKETRSSELMSACRQHVPGQSLIYVPESTVVGSDRAALGSRKDIVFMLYHQPVQQCLPGAQTFQYLGVGRLGALLWEGGSVHTGHGTPQLINFKNMKDPCLPLPYLPGSSLPRGPARRLLVSPPSGEEARDQRRNALLRDCSFQGATI